jgi:hypothetical protein
MLGMAAFGLGTGIGLDGIGGYWGMGNGIYGLELEMGFRSCGFLDTIPWDGEDEMNGEARGGQNMFSEVVEGRRYGEIVMDGWSGSLYLDDLFWIR